MLLRRRMDGILQNEEPATFFNRNPQLYGQVAPGVARKIFPGTSGQLFRQYRRRRQEVRTAISLEPRVDHPVIFELEAQPDLRTGFDPARCGFDNIRSSGQPARIPGMFEMIDDESGIGWAGGWGLEAGG